MSGVESNGLQVFHADAGSGEWVVSVSAEDAAAVYQEYMGPTYVLTEEDPQPADWRPLSGAGMLTITSDETGKRDKKTCAEWVAANGRGFLCSGNY